jgi:hypothetical protein
MTPEENRDAAEHYCREALYYCLDWFDKKHPNAEQMAKAFFAIMRAVQILADSKPKDANKETPSNV